IRRIKIIGWCSNNDGIRPGEGSIIDKIFIKTSDDYNYYRGPHVMRNAVMWPGVNGAVGQLGWNDLGVGGAEYYNLNIINSEWHLDNMQKSNIGIINGGKANAGIKLVDNILQDVQIENRTNYLVAVKLSGTGTGYLRNFTVKNVSTEYPFSNPAGNTVKQELRGASDTWCENWTFTNLFVDGVLVTWDNHKDYFNLNLTGTNGNNTDNDAKTKNVKFDSYGAIHTITYTKTNGGMVRPTGNGNNIQIAQGMDQSISIIPDDGYRIKSITVDGHKKYEYASTSDNQRKQAWIFENVSSNHSIDVEFEAGDDYFDIEYDLLHNSVITMQEKSIYPIPTKGLVYVENLDINAVVYVYNIAGVVQEKIVLENSNTIDLRHLQNGVYILEIIENNKRFITKVIKE
ncbi:MAG: T9SS type A sorting domain-containing protein, partial [Bacteroidales bacterium]|nr:T9SS type A sorting domain-containing protein [Bacteroidales bacterium]